MALATSPRLLIADEPTTGLDVSIAAQILDLLRDLGRRTGAAILLITHDLGVVAGICDRVAVMHAGQVVEWADVRRLFKTPAHPYTCGLLGSVPRLDREFTMAPIAGVVPSLLDPPAGCRFWPRCGLAMEVCRTRKPPPAEIAPGHVVACFATGAAPR
jgi:oligopeptide/dipeptide ABC transporter ATP-binding protein